MSTKDLRREYDSRGLQERDLDPNPLKQLDHWLRLAVEAELPDPNAMTLATCSVEGVPSARIVLLRGVDDRGLRFYTNYDSRKGRELEANPQAAAVLFWSQLDRQVRVEGPVERLPLEDSDGYFAGRPRDSQLAAWASAQSEYLADRAELERLMAQATERFEGQQVPRPPNWGGYRLVPKRIEFWQGRPGRLHDRLTYIASDRQAWRIQRLAP